jgi:glycosyltransferase involved in cell wall biosynthesis
MNAGKSGRHIVFICSGLDTPGGTERAVVNTANLFQENGHKVTIIILDKSSESFYLINSNINVLQYNLHLGINVKGNMISRKIALFDHIRRLKKILKETTPDTIIGTEYSLSIASWMAARNLNIRVYSWEHHHFFWIKKNKFWNYLFHRIYPRLDAVICLNSREQLLFIQHGCNAIVIPNFVSIQSKSELHQNCLLTVGWLIKRKGVDLIPDIAEQVFAKHPEWKWKIIGSGKQLYELEKEIESKELSDNIIIVPPDSSDLNKIYIGSSIYIMTSRLECFPMVLLEAMSFGIPCISFDCLTGPAEIIQSGKDGMLIENENSFQMALAIDGLITDEKRRIELGNNAFKNVGKFSPENIYKLWEALLIPKVG